MSGPPDERLLAAYRAGDVDAFEALLGRYRMPLFNVILRLVRDRGRAEEIYQDVWLKVIERSDEFRGDAKFSAWLYTIARNLCIDHLRKAKLRNHRSLDQPVSGSEPPPVGRVPNPGPSPQASATGRLAGARIARAVERLPHEQREVFLLRHLQGLAFREIAEVVGASPNTVKSRMRYAIEHLRAALADWKEADDV